MRSLVIILVLIPLFFSCETEEVSTIISTEIRDLPEFSKLNLEDLGDADIIISNDFKIEITTHVNVLDDIRTNVDDGELEIELRGRHKNIRVLDYKVFVPTLERITLEGVGNIRCFDPLESDNIFIYQDGVGNIDLRNIKAETVYAKLNDVGDIILSGEADNIAYDLEGVGSIQAFGLEALIGEAVLDGVGDIEINAIDDLTIKNDGVGKVYYLGNPTLHISGKNNGIVKKD